MSEICNIIDYVMAVKLYSSVCDYVYTRDLDSS